MFKRVQRVSTNVPICVQWNARTRSAFIQDNIRGKLNDAIATKGSKVTFQFMSNDSEICSRTYIVKAVHSRGNSVSSFVLREKSLLLRIIPDIFLPAKYRIGLNRILPININGTEEERHCFKAAKEISTSALTMRVRESDYRIKDNGVPRDKLLLTPTVTISTEENDDEQLGEGECVAKFGYREHESREVVKVNAITKMKMVSRLIKTEKPLVAVDVDQVLTKLAAEREEEIAEAATEEGIKLIFEKLKIKYPDAHFIALSNGKNTTAKLEKIDMKAFFDKVIDSKDEDYFPHIGKGQKILHYLDKLDKSKFEATEIVMIDDQLINHHHVDLACSKKYTCTNILYLGAIDNLAQCRDVKKMKKLESVRNSDDPSKFRINQVYDLEDLGAQAQQLHFARNLANLMSAFNQRSFQEKLLFEELGTL